MYKIKRLANLADPICRIEPNISSEELVKRINDYNVLSDKKMKTLYIHSAFREVHLHWGEKEYEIQVNYCSDPFCKNHRQPQEDYKIGKSKRYKFTGKDGSRTINCVPDPTNQMGVPTLGCYTKTFSNWSLATEIERLVRINSTVPLEPDYEFHKDDCSENQTYFENPKSFYKRGKATSKAQIVQCKSCKKYTNILPNKSQTTSYTQKRNDILLTFAEHLINRVPVSSTCKILGIGRSTYYSKLEWLYRCCLEFLEIREAKQFAKQIFPRIWLNTDMMMYYLNNVRKKGQPRTKGTVSEKQLQTQTVVTTDLTSRYVFRADIAYDWDIDFKKIEMDTLAYKDDHLPVELRKNAKYTNYSYYPMEPIVNDTQSSADYYREIQDYMLRGKYVDGLHINHTYTAMAQMFLIKQMVKTDKWRVVSDDDMVLKSAIKKVFAEEISKGRLHYFVNTFDKTLSREAAFQEYIDANKHLKNWAESNGLKEQSDYEVAIEYLRRRLAVHKFYETKVAPDGTPYNVHKSNKIEHPIAMADRGSRYIDVISDTSKVSDEHLARLITRANDNAVNAFLQEIRRSLSILERPLVTSRGDGKSYIYSNFNPKYAQMAITILRTYYNFCQPFKTYGDELTPAQRIGIAKRAYSWRDIIYKR
ncbi:insertion element protein [Mesobacillus subterraneus]|uniref:insertion element protein n=1 Tax=Mesobacillus subterraneus TaxID=285983 RepID=UPI001CFE791C|nr:insertion element protein [Mesobacillus subterraneus]WLR55435.1 insertion element protein [Mesobacillus subterraneus]